MIREKSMTPCGVGSVLLVSMLAVLFANPSFAVTEKDTAPAPNGGVVEKKSVAPKDAAIITEAEKIDTSNIDVVKNVQNNSLTPDEVKKIRGMWEDLRRNEETPAGTQPRPVVSIVSLNLSPGVTPPIVRVSDRTGAIMDFMDASGTPWPIDHIINMSANEIDVGDKPLDPKVEQNSFFAKSKRYGSIGNVAVFLKDLPTPVIITLLAGQKDSDYRVDFRVPAYLSSSHKTRYEKKWFDDRLASATMGITPAGCGRLHASTKEVMVWGCGGGSDKEAGSMIVRVEGMLLSPSPIDGKKVDSLDGTKVYEIPTSPVVSVSIDGRVSFVKVDIKEED